MSEERAQQDDVFVGIIFATLHPGTGHITWCFKEYDPEDKASFPVLMQFKQAGELFVPKNPGRVLDVQNGDALVVFMDREYKHPLVRGKVKLDYEIGKVPDPLKPDEQVQMIGGNRVNGIPTNVDPITWSELFFEGRPAALFRQTAAQTLDNSDNRFGLSEADIAAAFSEHADAGIMRAGCYVPTRSEVSTMAPAALIPLLQDWFWESPSQLIPSGDQEKAVIALLMQRSDATDFGSFIRDVRKFEQAALRAVQGGALEPKPDA